MSNTNNKENPNLLEIVHTSSTPENKVVVIAGNESGKLSLKIETSKGYGNGATARTIVQLWNEYQKLPYHLKLSPAMVFSMILIADDENNGEDIRLIKEDLMSAKWWNNVYRWSLFSILMGLIVFALVK